MESCERRRFPRTNGGDGIIAKVIGRHIPKLFKVINISCGGALLRATRIFQSGEILDMSLYLPQFRRSIYVQARVVRIVAKLGCYGLFPKFEIGVEFVKVAPVDTDKLSEAVEALLRAGK